MTNPTGACENGSPNRPTFPNLPQRKLCEVHYEHCIPTVKDRIAQTAVKFVLEPILEARFHPASFGFRPGRGAKDALRVVDRLVKSGCCFVVDADLKSYLDVASYYPLAHAVGRKRLGCGAKTLMRSPFCLPRITWTASSSPRLTRCNTV
jgi:Reverse transcriptase (RNA-dependent DNA polymerase)